MPSDIPTARKLLDEALKEKDEQKQRYLLRLALNFMTRDTPRRLDRQSKLRNDDIVASIKLMHHTNPDMHQSEIASALNVDFSLVSEVLSAKRKKDTIH